MPELGKYYKIYCHQTHRKWPELVPYIENWLNTYVSQTTGYAPVELLYGNTRPNIFLDSLKYSKILSQDEPLEETLIMAYAKMRLRAEKRYNKGKKSKRRWKPKLQEQVLVKCQPMSDTVQGITGKFQRPYEGPYLITKIVSAAIYELGDSTGRSRGIFNISHLKPYLTGKPDEVKRSNQNNQNDVRWLESNWIF
jgi:hypothetical protein